jgi:hypothetical protein
MLGNGYCARPVEMNCHPESICESCTFFAMTIAFRPTLQQQRDDAERKGQVGRQKILTASSHASTRRRRPADASTTTCLDHPHMYNPRRGHSAFGYESPLRYEQVHAAEPSRARTANNGSAVTSAPAALTRRARA